MLKWALMLFAVMSFSTMVHADSFTVTLAQGGAIITTVDEAIIDNPSAFLTSGAAQTDYALGLTDYTVGIFLEDLGQMSSADSDFIAAQNYFNSLLTILDAPATVNFDPAPPPVKTPEPSTFAMLAVGIAGLLFFSRKRLPGLSAGPAAELAS